MITEEQYYQQKEIHNKFREEVENLIEQYIDEFGDIKHETIDDWEIEGGFINVCTELYYGSGYGDYNSHSIPVSYLWDDSWIEAAREAKRREAEEKIRQQQEKKRKDEERQKRFRRAQYEKLRKEFEDVK